MISFSFPLLILVVLMAVVFAFIPEFGQSKRLPCHVSSLWIVLFCDLGWIPGAVYSMIT